jgi:hypothetical protein
MKSVGVATLCLLTLGLFAVPAMAASATGVWKGEVKLPNGQALPFVARLTHDGPKITGKLDGINGAPDVPIVNGKIADGTVTFSGVRVINKMPVTFNYTATFVDDDTLHFKIVRADGSGMPLESVTKRTKE